MSKSEIKLRGALKRLVEGWRIQELSYDKSAASLRCVGDALSANRYRGIATAFRWSAEDLQELLK